MKSNLKSQIQTKQFELLKQDKSGHGYVCPLCGSGTGAKGTGMMTKDGIHFTCFACGEISNADIFDIIGKQYGLDNFGDKIKKCCELLKIPYKSETDEITPFAIEPEPEETPCDNFLDYYNKAHLHVNDTTYHRGLSNETLAKFNIGYDNSWVNPAKPEAKSTKRLIIPISETTYLARSVDSDDAYSKINVGQKDFFNFNCINTSDSPIFIVEGELDALSIIDVGGEAVALSGLSNVNKFLEKIDGHFPSSPMIIALDNEDKDKVRKATSALQDGLKNLGIPVVVCEPYGDCKDANEALCKDKEAFADSILKATDYARNYSPNDEYKATNTADSILEKLSSHTVSAVCYPTGFERIDAVLDGGLYPSLIVVGAVSSLGKTTLCLNIADKIAESGTDVLFFSLEMDAVELVSKSTSRISYQKSAYPKTARDIMSRTTEFLSGEKEALSACVKYYKTDIGKNLFIIDSLGNIGVNEVRKIVEKHMRFSHKPCVVFIDYLQILKQLDVRATDKQNVDQSVYNLKEMSRDLNIPVVAISSFNRESYDTPVSLASFKESGAIEYSSDCLIGLQPTGMDYIFAEKKEERNKRIADLIKENEKKANDGQEIGIDFRVLKDRNGSKGTANLLFCPKYNCFSEEKEATPFKVADDFDF